MPPKSKRKTQLEQARAVKQTKVTEDDPTLSETSISEPTDLPQPSTSGASFNEPIDHEMYSEGPEMQKIYTSHRRIGVNEWIFQYSITFVLYTFFTN